MYKIFENRKGYSLVEMLIYISILSVFSLTIISTILSFTQSYRTLLALRMVDNTGIDAMERISRDIRAAGSVVSEYSVFGVNPSMLTLINTSGGTSTTTKFYLQNGVLHVDVNGVYFGPLSVASSSVTSLVFRHMQSGISSAVMVELTVQGTVGQIVKSKTYRTTVVLRGV